MATDIDCNAEWLSPLDVRDQAALARVADDYKPDWIFHLAALTDVEYCEVHSRDAFETNAVATENVALLCQRLNIPLVYISTAGVFDGAKETYSEYDPPNPLSVYGKSKLAGERAVQHLLHRYYIFRAGWMMGGGPQKDKKFVNKFLRQIREGSTDLSAVDDKLGSPTYTYDFAANLLTVIESGNYGLYHMVGQGECSRYDVAEEILRLLRLRDRVTLAKVSSSQWAKEYFAPRPRSEKLVNLKLDIRGMNNMRPWKESLTSYIAQHDWGV